MHTSVVVAVRGAAHENAVDVKVGKDKKVLEVDCVGDPVAVTDVRWPTVEFEPFAGSLGSRKPGRLPIGSVPQK